MIILAIIGGAIGAVVLVVGGFAYAWYKGMSQWGGQ